LKDLLARLRPRHRLAVATNRSTTIGQVLELFGLKDFFDMVVSSLDVRRPKPHPESLLKILDFFHIPPDAAVYIGDSSIDAETARAARVPFIAYKNEALEAGYHARAMADIAGIVNGRRSPRPSGSAGS
jgi:HAD superfamily hydrolase (TIGR01509 family)